MSSILYYTIMFRVDSFNKIQLFLVFLIPHSVGTLVIRQVVQVFKLLFFSTAIVIYEEMT